MTAQDGHIIRPGSNKLFSVKKLRKTKRAAPLRRMARTSALGPVHGLCHSNLSYVVE
jgi:hypothetical protein